MKFIFLDIDGVLNHHPGGDISGEPNVEHRQAKRLNRIIDSTGAVLVITSAWREHYDLGGWESFLAEHGVGCEVEGILPPGDKAVELLRWLDYYEVEDFVVIDDMRIHPCQVLTKSFVGLTDEDADEAIRILNS